MHVEVAYERSSPCFDGQIIHAIVPRMASSAHDNGNSCSDRAVDEHLESLAIERVKRELASSRFILCTRDRVPS